MKLLIIYTHPNHESLCYSFLQKILQGSNENSNVKDIKVLDLYEEKFNPLLVFNRDKPRRNLYCDAELEKYRQQIIWADKLAFVYPIWWGRPPAMLLGYIDQIFASNFAYRYKGFASEGLLEGRSAVCISTMRGPTNYPLFFLHDAHKVLMKKALFNYVGIKKVKFFEFGNMESKNGKQVEKLNKIYNYFKNIDL